MQLGEKIKKLRVDHKISRNELANILGISYSTISKYETNVRRPDNEMLKNIADYFRVSADYLLGREEKTNSLPPLTKKEERDIAKDLEDILEGINSSNSLSFYGEPMDEETKELMKISLENSMKMAKQIAKQKFTPKKYRKK